MSERVQSALLLGALVVLGIASWMLWTRPTLEIEISRLTQLPTRLGDWRSEEVPIASGVEEMLDADLNVQRSYRHPMGDLVWLYLGYYGTERGGRPEHTPEACYPSNGWTITATRTIPSASLPAASLNELTIEQGNERRLVHFWYQSQRSPMLLGGFDHAWDRIVGRIASGRADGALVRLSTPVIAGDEGSARGRLQAMERELVPALRESWPLERPRGDPVSS